MPRGQKTKTRNRSNIVTNPIKTLTMVHIKNKSKKQTNYGVIKRTEKGGGRQRLIST